MSNAKIIGKKASSSQFSANGIWSLNEIFLEHSNSSWPIPVPPIRDGLVLFLDAANPNSYSGSGTSWNDLSGKNNNATISGSFSYSSSNSGYITLSGGGGVSTVTSQDFNFSSNNFTIEYWFYGNTTMNSTNVYYLIAKTGNNAFLNGIWRSGLHPGDTYNTFSDVSKFGTSGSTTGYVGANYPVTGRWNHFAYTGNGSEYKFYVNGQPWATNTPAGITNEATNFIFGGPPDSFLGNVSIISTYDRGLSDQEILRNFDYFSPRYGI